MLWSKYYDSAWLLLRKIRAVLAEKKPISHIYRMHLHLSWMGKQCAPLHMFCSQLSSARLVSTEMKIIAYNLHEQVDHCATFHVI